MTRRLRSIDRWLSPWGTVGPTVVDLRRFPSRRASRSRTLRPSVTEWRTSSIVWLLGKTRFARRLRRDRKSTRLNSSHVKISYADFCLKKKKIDLLKIKKLYQES